MGTPRRRPSSDEVIWKMLVEGERPTKADVAKLGLDKEVFLRIAMKLVRSHLNRMRGHRPLVELASPDYDRCSDARARLTQQPAAQRVWEVASWVRLQSLHGTQHFAATIYLAMSGKWLIAESSGAASMRFRLTKDSWSTFSRKRGLHSACITLRDRTTTSLRSRWNSSPLCTVW